ncbi:penicillin-binding transpeptidase domain-containing protein [Streptomyces sp. NPDC059070]|uniref:penicillin-binding transpeptidase domain-containing protein n=1 Tax=Streptomyces sp. NPDC059070 TaxID=3346713 RepID=UPI0036A52435
MRSKVKVAIAGGVFAVVASGVGYGAYNVWDALNSGSSGSAPVVHAGADGVQRHAGPVTPDEVRDTAQRFLAAWGEGRAVEAAALTDNAAGAEPLLDGYRTAAHVTRAVITPGAPDGARVPFTVRATVTYQGTSVPWSYTSQLSVVRGHTTGRALVDWQPSVIHPQLARGESLVTGPSRAPAVKALDRKGRELDREHYPSLGPVLDALRTTYGRQAGGTAGIELSIISPEEQAPPRTLLTVVKGRVGELRTTLDADVQAAAEKAVQQHPESSAVALQASTGQVRAVANHRRDGFNAAVLGRRAPGSTMKIVTAALLLEKGLVTAEGPAECPTEAMYYGRTFHNQNHFSLTGKPFSESFARSCNTAFIKLIDDTHDDAALAAEAREVFGIGLDWQTGIPTWDGSVPPATGGEAAAQYIGQGNIQMNPLTLASITATATTGTFHQPLLTPRPGARPPATATRTLPKPAARQLRDMMRLTATQGTGAAAMAGVPGDTGAKTGSAEVDGHAAPDSWFTGFADDLTAAAVVESGGHGADAAGPVVASILKAR